jgi:hypothetical protein
MLESLRKPRKVDITKMPIWEKRWDPAGDLMEKASEFTSETARYYLGGGFLEARIYELAPKLWNPRERGMILNDDTAVEMIIRRIQDGWAENLRTLIDETMQYAYEAAAMPTDSEISQILHDSSEEARLFESYEHYDYAPAWDLIASERARRSKKEWRPNAIARSLSYDEVSDALRKSFRYYRENNHYDRYIVFDCWPTVPIQALVGLKLPEEAQREVLHDISYFYDRVLMWFEKKLENLEIDVDARYDFKVPWLEQMKRDDWVEPIRKEIAEILEG